MRYALLLVACLACGGGPRFVDYIPAPDLLTPAGIEVTSNGNAVSLRDIDRIVDEYKTCAGVERLPYFEVLIPPSTMPDGGGWYISPCTGNQIFPCSLPPTACGAVVEGCPCRCSGAWDDEFDLVVVTPNLKALAHELIHVQLQAGGHSSPLFEKCEGIR